MADGVGPTRRQFLGGVAGTATLGAGCLSSGSPAPEEGDNYDVGMSSIAFAPKHIEVSAGTTVVWKNTNSRTHTVTAYGAQIPDAAEYFASGGFDDQETAVDAYYNQLAGGIVSEETYSHTFSVPGEYRYFCVPHEQAGMVGTVTVTE